MTFDDHDKVRFGKQIADAVAAAIRTREGRGVASVLDFALDKLFNDAHTPSHFTYVVVSHFAEKLGAALAPAVERGISDGLARAGRALHDTSEGSP